jgi:osomolarity two-component system response regulator SKN7
VDEQFNGAAATQQVAALAEQFAAMQHQVQGLQESYSEIVGANKIFVDEIIHLQKLVRSQKEVNSELINYLSKLEQDRRDSRHSNSGHSNHSTPGYVPNSNSYQSDGVQDVSAELRRARDILSGLTVEHAADPDLKRMSIAFAQQPGASPESAGSSSMMAPPGSAGFNPFMHDPLNDMRHLVYPVGQTIGIDPFAAEHMGNIPYNRPVQEGGSGSTPEVNMAPGISQTPLAATTTGGGPWGLKKPIVLLVEDDKTCSRIGSKFLAQYDCGVEVARDGIEAVNKVNSKPQYYDLIFMDIVMPQLDGVSATAMIREVMPNVPIIAMTSNINQQDLEMYFHWGKPDTFECAPCRMTLTAKQECATSWPSLSRRRE